MWKKFEGRWCGSEIQCGYARCAKGDHDVDAVCEWFLTRWRGERDHGKVGVKGELKWKRK